MVFEIGCSGDQAVSLAIESLLLRDSCVHNFNKRSSPVIKESVDDEAS